MKRFSFGIVVGLLIGLLTASTLAFANAPPIKLLVNGAEINCGACPPQIVNGHTLVPARVLAEALDCTVLWDEVGNAVIITKPESTPTASTNPTMPQTVTQDTTMTVNNGATTSTATTPVKTNYPAPEPGKTVLSFDGTTYRYLEDEPNYKERTASKRNSTSTNEYTEFNAMGASEASTGDK